MFNHKGHKGFSKCTKKKGVAFSFLRVLCVCFVLFVVNFTNAQKKNIPLIKDAEWLLQFYDAYVNDSLPLHSNFKPIIENKKESIWIEKAFVGSKKFSETSLKETSRAPYKWFRRKVKYESFIIINDTADKFHLTVDPLFNLQYGKDNEDKTGEKLYTNTRGFIARGDIGSDFSFETSFLENQSTLPNYLDAFAQTFNVIPGQGRWKKFKTNGYDYAMASGYISYSPNKHFNFQLGHGKNFVGDGYRSLLLSDLAFNYPYLRVTANYRKIQYTQLYAVLMNMSSGTTPVGTERLFQKKAASFQLFSWNIHKRLQVGLFQGMIWEAADSTNKQHLNVNYFNPVILSNLAIYSLDMKNNVLLGATMKYRPWKTVSIYGQYVIDNCFDKSFDVRLPGNKQGFQLGLRGIDLFKVRNLNFLIEYNRVRPFTYSHEKPSQSYSHYNQPLGHPLGANFEEYVFSFGYRFNDFFTTVKMTSSRVGTNYLYNANTVLPVNAGNNIFITDNPAYILSAGNLQFQGENVFTKCLDFKIGYVINPVTNMNISVGIFTRNARSENSYQPFTSNTSLFYISFRTSLSNIYYDF